MVISVIIPVYNAEESIVKCLDSIKNQTWKGEFEIIVINDGSTDRSGEILENYRQKNPEMPIQLIHQENGGVSKARNAGLKIAKGDYIALLDSDDEWLPEKTEKQVKYLVNPDFGVDFLASCRTNQKILFPYRLGLNNLAEITFNKLMIRNEAQPSSVIFDKKILSNTGYFDPEQKYAEDLNFWLRISLNNRMFILGEKLLIAAGEKRTFGFSGLSANLSAMEKGFNKNLQEMYQLGKVSFLEFFFFKVFYFFKYILRISRSKWAKIMGK